MTLGPGETRDSVYLLLFSMIYSLYRNRKTGGTVLWMTIQNKPI